MARRVVRSKSAASLTVNSSGNFDESCDGDGDVFCEVITHVLQGFAPAISRAVVVWISRASAQAKHECGVSQEVARDVTCGSASNAEQLFRVCIAVRDGKAIYVS